MGEVREENEKLKLLLARIVADYQSLQSQLVDILRQQETEPNPSTDCKSPDDHDHHHPVHQKNDHDKKPRDHDDQLVSLSLGRTSNDERRSKNEITKKNGNHDQEGLNDGELALALGSLSETTKNSSSHNNADHDKDEKEDDDQEVEPTEMWPPSKVLKTARSSGDDQPDDGVSQNSPLKKARVTLRVRCDAPTVQRCAEDMSILTTTYEGNHNHSLPISATAMASTTSAAASILQSRSTTSSSSHPNFLLPSAISGSNSAATSSYPNLPAGLNFSSTTTSATTLFQNPITRSSSQQQFYFPNTSISTCNSHPTVTLDLTVPNHPYSPHILGRGLSSNTSSALRYPSTCLNFSSSSSPASSSVEPINSHYINSYFNYRNNYPVGSNVTYKEAGFYQPFMNSNTTTTTTNQQSLTETISAATKAIASNPNFQSALAAALTSFVGKGGTGV
ncbi:hypothetical protein TIFTF001_010997 [Ficus carica]|uniref:WRKY domain-containing protein n=1 Tax=Ficus carica TaxID=3494 RepID=A0AA88A9N5_FICCA|nr:hypothetical protein TIFTF001_010997 [Ficus carica]